MSTTGENEMGLRKILDLIRFTSLFMLFLHFYFYCYSTFKLWGVRSDITDRVLSNTTHTGLFVDFNRSKLISLGLLAISLLGARGKKKMELQPKVILLLIAIGFILFFVSNIIMSLQADEQMLTISYVLVASTGYLFVLSGGNLLSRLIQDKMHKDVFNEFNETFPQQEKLIENDFSIHFRGKYRLKDRTRDSYICLPNPFSGTLVVGRPGSGKSWFVLLPAIRQLIEKGYAMLIYDFKYDDLSKPAYNWMLANLNKYGHEPSFYSINLDYPELSNQCNPLYPASMKDISDAVESASSVLIGLNREWIKKQSDFFVQSAINFLTAIIWYLRKYSNGEFCTLPHAIEMMQVDYDELFPVLQTQPEVQAYISDFAQSLKDGTSPQLNGQVASAKVGMAKLSSPQLYWTLSGNDFTLDINDPEKPKIICLGNNPEKQAIYGAVLSLYISRLVKLVNQKGKQKCALVFDEFPTIYFNSMDALIATARSNKVATFLGMQDFSQLRKDYGKEQADVITNICGNIISGQVMGDSAKSLSERFGKIMQERQSISINRMDTSISKSMQLDYAIPASKISALSSGEFVGMVADNPDEKIKLKMFHAEVINDSDAMNIEMKTFVDLPVVKEIAEQKIMDNYYQIKHDIQMLVDQEMYRLRMLEEEIDEL
ncbi:Type IV secretory system Conjugative DNA transfer [Hydrobacter penzbergensis]|uniref:Type IV secretory system Conjugative DNA transfer n=1 Tax=Hydrobacter penzbergensis TaxID=1235997 RepID=A0A8X8IDX1_9BACT|nr:conjugal transfer protein MobC [Hydrobacter penzbergensis]SDW46303.1 Type IV secretory system Conjugative DNA transfer [Hydrobacter penzbergensis]